MHTVLVPNNWPGVNDHARQLCSVQDLLFKSEDLSHMQSNMAKETRTLTEMGFVERVVDNWRPSYTSLKQISWRWELVVTLEHEPLSSELSTLPPTPFTISRSSTAKASLKTKSAKPRSRPK